MPARRIEFARLARPCVALGVAVLLALGVACGGSDDGDISEQEVREATSRYIQTTLGLFTGTTEADAFIELFAPECREGVDAESLAFVLMFIQALAPELQGIVVEAVDVGELVIEETTEGTLVAPRDPDALRVRVDGEFVSIAELFGDLGFEAVEEEDVAEPVLLVKRNGNIYLGDCSELEGFFGG